MKTNDNAPQGTRPIVWVPVITALVISVGLLIFFRAPKHIEANTIKNIQAPVVVPASMPKHHTQIAHAEMFPQSVSDIAPETVAALAQFGLPATNLSKITVVAQSRPPVIIPNPIRKTQ
jgi:hypothetical protein